MNGGDADVDTDSDSDDRLDQLIFIVKQSADKPSSCVGLLNKSCRARTKHDKSGPQLSTTKKTRPTSS
jgi:hypothetical protein